MPKLLHYDDCLARKKVDTNNLNMETKRKMHHRVYRRVPEEMRLEIAKDYYLGQKQNGRGPRRCASRPPSLLSSMIRPVGGRLRPPPYASVSSSGSGVGSSSLPPLLTSFIFFQWCSQLSALAALLVLQVDFRQVSVVVLRRLRQALLRLQLLHRVAHFILFIQQCSQPFGRGR